MSIRLLGPVSVPGPDGRELLPAGARVRGLLARLALDAGRPVDAATLVDALWGDDPPATANALQSLASRLRRALGDGQLRSAAGGYVLVVDPDAVDALRFAALRRAAAQADDRRGTALLTEALELWHGPVLGGVRELPFAEPAAARLAEARAGAAEDLAARGLAGGVPDAGRDVLTAVLDEDPLRETTAVALARGLHAGGRRADALAVLDRTRAALADELGVDPGPELRGVRTELLRDDAPPPPARTATNGRATPGGRRAPALTSFVGRADDLARIRALTRTSRLVTVTGPGGAGKTRLSLEAVSDLEVPVSLAELAALTGADRVLPTVLHAVGGPELALGEHGGHDALSRLRTALGDREQVLLLDNCEHVVDAVADLVHDLLSTVGGLVVLATSREPLGVPGEVLHPLGALDERHAARLFAERAAAVRPDFEPTRHEAAVKEICRRLDGQPLPIELAAARVRSVEPAEIAERLADRFRLLVSGPRTVLPRHQTLRAVVDWSWDLLSPAERAAAARFGVFAGAVDGRVVAVVCGDEGFDLLGALVEKSLVVPVPDATPGPTRYRMLETIREYAVGRLAESGEYDAVVEAHAAAVLAVLEPGEPRLRSADQLDQLVVVRGIEREALRALERAVDGGDADRAHRLLAALGWSWVVRGDMAALSHWSGRVAELPEPTAAMAVALNRTLRAVLLASLSDTAVGRAETAAVEAILPALPRPWHPVVELHVPTVRAFAGDRSALVALADGDGEPWLRAAAANIIAVHAENAGEPDVQRRYLRQAHDLFAALDDRFGLGMTTFSLGELEDLAGDRVAARRAYTEAVALSEELRNVDDLPQYRLQLALLAGRDGDAAEAHAQLEVAEQIASGSTEPWAAAWLAWGRADVERRLGNPERALGLLDLTRPAFVDGPGPGRGQREAMVHDVAAAALIDLGRYGEARDRLDAAARAASDSDDGPVIGQVAEVAARWSLLTGDAERAGELLGVALARRGALHLGDPDVVATREGVVARLGPAAADAAVDRGRAGPRDVPPRP